MFQPGSRILAQYSNGAGEPLHERVVLAKSFGSFYALCSPDEDVYTECIGGTEDIITYWLIAADGSRPPLPAGRRVYGFGDFTCFDGAAGAAKIREGIADAVVHRGTQKPDLGPDPSEVLAEAAATRAEGGIAQPVGLFGVVAAAPTGGGVPPAAPGAAPAPAGGGLPAGFVVGPPAAVANEEWIVASVDDTSLVPRYGDTHTPGAGAIINGAVGMDTLPGGRIIYIKRIATSGVKDCLKNGHSALLGLMGAMRIPGAETDPGSSVDSRVLSAKFNAQGKRHREYSECCEHLSEPPWKDWPLTGPRTCRWYARFILESNRVPQARTLQWMRDTGVPETDRVRHEHGLLCDVLQTAMTYDQLEVSSLCCFELLARRLQLLEEAYSASPKAPRFDGQQHFMGQGRKQVAIAPALTAHVAGELRDEAAVAKERRKAREEHALRDKK